MVIKMLILYQHSDIILRLENNGRKSCGTKEYRMKDLPRSSHSLFRHSLFRNKFSFIFLKLNFQKALTLKGVGLR